MNGGLAQVFTLLKGTIQSKQIGHPTLEYEIQDSRELLLGNLKVGTNLIRVALDLLSKSHSQCYVKAQFSYLASGKNQNRRVVLPWLSLHSVEFNLFTVFWCGWPFLCEFKEVDLCRKLSKAINL